MKQITNWASATVFDIEADDLLEGATKMHVLSYKMKNMEIKSIKGDDHSAIASFFKFHIEQGIPMVAHNGITYDVPLVEKILKVDLSKLMVVDTLLLSWALSPKRVKHGLDSFFDDYGIAKPPITDWQGLTYEEYENRCVEDVKINTALWDDLQARLIDMYSRVKDEVDSGNVGGSRTDEKEVLYIDRYVHTSTVADYIDRYISFLMYKGDSARLREKTKFKLDEEYVDRSKDTLEGLLELAKAELESIMPEVPQYKEVKFPKNPRKALTKKQIDSGQTKGDLSAQGKKWNDTLKLIGKYDDRGTALAIHTGKKTFKEKEKVLADDGVTTVEITVEVVRDTISVLSGYNEPNANSPEQIKDFLYSKGWIPRTFKFVKDEAAMQAWVDGGFRGDKPKQRAIPQITVDGDGGKVLCESVEELAEESPEIARYATYGMIKHRLGLFKGFQRDVVNGHLVAGVAGYTNTLRDKHRELVNLPATGKPWGKELRGALVAGDGNVLLGSDMSALEDRVKHHFMLAHDPEYVETMTAADYDPHLAMAITAGLITKEQAQAYTKGERDEWVVKARGMGKTANYACLPYDITEVLTSKGWKYLKDVVVGEQVLSYKDGKAEFCKVIDTVDSGLDEVVILNNGIVSLESTKDHRWLVDRRVRTKSNPWVVREYKTTGELHSDMNIVTTATYTGGNSKVTEDEAYLMGCILADGSLSCSKKDGSSSQGTNSQKQAVRMSLSQSRDKFLDTMLNVSDRVGLEYNTYTNNSGVVVIDYSSPSSRGFLTKLGLPLESKHDIDYTEWLLGLTTSALGAFYQGLWESDGNTGASGLKGSRMVYQNRGKIQQAIALCSYLLGSNTLISGDEYTTITSQLKQTVGLQKAKQSVRMAEVGCLVTENSNFVVRQGDFTFLTGNCVYGAGAATIARAAGVDEATGKVLHTAYWKLNWSVKAIAEEQCVIKCSKGQLWLVNPINGFCYSLRAEKDIFSTLCQGTGSFLFDRWVDHMLELMYERFKVKRLSAAFHDELVVCFRDTEANRDTMEKLTRKAIELVNNEYNLRREMGCDVQFGTTYADIH